MKHYFTKVRRGLALTVLFAAGSLAAQAQNVGIGTTAPNASAVLDIVSTTKGALLPRLTAVQRTGIASPATGLLVFQTDAPAGYYYNAGTPTTPSWQLLSADNLGNHTATQVLNLQGNALTGTGTSIGSTVGIGVRADGGLNIGQNNGGNIYLGYQAGQSNTTGSFNLFSGISSGANNTTGSNNQFSGSYSGQRNTMGSDNLFSGISSGTNNTTGFSNQFSGTNSGFSNTTGSDNLFSGTQSGYNNTTGYNNLFSGYNSGASNTTGTNNTALGNNSGPARGSGGLTNATALGANVSLTRSNTVILGSAANVGIGTQTPTYKLDVVGDINASGAVRSSGVVLTSDRRLKRNITPSAYGLNTVLGLRPVQYQKKATIQSTAYERHEIGFIAQELQQLLPTLVSEGSDADKTLAVSYTELIPVLTKAIQEQQAQIEALKAQNAALQTGAAQATADHAALQTMQQQLARLLGDTAPANAQARK